MALLNYRTAGEDNRADNKQFNTTTFVPNQGNGEGVLEDPMTLEQPKDPFGNEVAGNAANGVQQTQTPEISSYLDLMKLASPKPTYDKGREKRLEAIASAKGVGKALSVLGDIYGLAKGGPVIPTKIEQGSPEVDMMMKDRAEYLAKMDAAERQDYLTRLGLASKDIGEANTERRYQTSAGLQEKRFEYQKNRDDAADRRYQEGVERDEQRYKDKKETDQERYADTVDRYERQYGLDLRKVENMEDRQAAADAIRIQEAKLKAEGKGLRLYNSMGQAGPMLDNEDEVRRLASEIINDAGLKEKTAAKFKLLKPSFGDPMSIHNQKSIIAEFWDQSEAAKKFLEAKGLGTAPAAQGTSTSGYRPPWVQQSEYRGPLRNEGQGDKPSAGDNTPATQPSAGDNTPATQPSAGDNTPATQGDQEGFKFEGFDNKKPNNEVKAEDNTSKTNQPFVDVDGRSTASPKAQEAYAKIDELMKDMSVKDIEIADGRGSIKRRATDIIKSRYPEGVVVDGKVSGEIQDMIKKLRAIEDLQDSIDDEDTPAVFTAMQELSKKS
jgi:hypothetical protein